MLALKILIGINIIIGLAVLISFWKIPASSFRVTSRVLRIFTAFLLFHLIYVFLSKVFFPSGGWVENSAPFGLAYGPFSYLCTRAYIKEEGIRKSDIRFFLPYLLFVLLHLGLMVSGVDHHWPFAELYLRVLYILTGLQFLVYGIWSGILLKGKLKKKEIFYHFFLIAAIAGILIFGILFIQVYLGSGEFWDETRVDLGGIMVYSFVFILLILLLVHVKSVRNTTAGNEIPRDSGLRADPGETVSGIHRVRDNRYAKSGLTDENLDWYESRLESYMMESKPWLRAELTLADLSQEMNIPAHHLTQLLNIRKQVNFNEYLNRYRVEYSCELLKNGGGLDTVEGAGYQSGFNSKTTYYRWFKKIKKMTPFEYQELHRS